MQLSLSETNTFLSLAGMDALDQHSLDAALQSLPLQRLMSALRQANKDIGAKRWLMNNLAPLVGNANMLQEQPAPLKATVHKEQPTRPAPVKATVPPEKPVVQPQQPTQTKPTQQHPATPKEHGQERIYQGHKIYGAKAALYFGCDVTRSGRHTLRLEGAISTAPKQFNWDNKIAVQMTQAELPMVAAVLFGFLKECEFKNHGASNNKGFKLQLQEKSNGKSLFVNVMEAKKPLVAVPVSPEDMFYVRNLLLGQMMLDNPLLDSAGLINSIRSYASMK